MLREFPRRAFITALGSLWGLSFTDEQDLIRSNQQDDNSDTNDSPKRKARLQQVPWAFLEERKGIYGELTVGMYPEDALTPIAIEGTTDRAQVSFGLSVEEAQMLAEQLSDAVEKVSSNGNQVRTD